MYFTHSIEQVFQQGNLPAISKKVTLTADGENNRDVVVAAEASNYLVAMVIDVSQLKMLYIVSSKDVTFETNSGGSPADTLTLLADVPVSWYPGCGYVCPLGTDVTAIYLTNAGDEDAAVQMRFLIDSTVS